MNRRIDRRVTLFGIGIVLVSGMTLAGAAEPKVGDKAPEFSLQGSDGKVHALSDYKGKSGVVLAWFPKAFTGGCTKECRSFASAGETLRGLKVAYFTASVDTAELNKKFAESLDCDYPILSDPDKSVAQAYGVVHEGRAVPERWTFYIDKQGVIKQIDKKVDTDKAAEDVAAKVKELGLSE